MSRATPRTIPSVKPAKAKVSKPAAKPAKAAPKAAVAVAPRSPSDPNLQLADALDGMASQLQRGKKVPKADLEAAGKAAHHLRPRHAPEEAIVAVRFETARNALLVSAPGAAAGKSPFTVDAEEAARRLAGDLRLYATGTLNAAGPAETATRARPGEVASRLRRRYARLAR
jgi:hypothetical protein